MLYNIQYVYGKNKNEEKTLIGAKVLEFDGEKTYVQEIYVGLEFSLEDIIENKINADAIGVTNLDILKTRYKNLNAAGIVYFPELERYEFLEEGDIVIPWISAELVASALEDALQPYKNKATDKVVREKVAARRAYVESLDPEDPMVELNGLSLGRHASNR